MEQLTQMEFLQLREILSTEALAIKKCKLYARDTGDEQLKALFDDAARVHEQSLDRLVGQLRSLSGKPTPESH